MTYLQLPRLKLEVTLLDGRCDLGNNLLEDTIRPLLLGSKNSVFAGSHRGAQRNVMMYLFIAGLSASPKTGQLFTDKLPVMMKGKRFTEEYVIRALKEYEAGRSTKGICRDLGISSATFCNWRKKYAGMEISQLRRPKELESENRKLKQMYADLVLDQTMLKDVLANKF